MLTRASFLLAALLAACGPSPTPPDAGADAPMPDVPTVDTGRDAPAGTCDDVTSQTLTVGTQALTGDNTGRSNDLPLTCGAADGTGPQEAIEIVMPGTSSDNYGLVLSLVNDGTAYDTVLELRPFCAEETDAICNDDAVPGELRSELYQLLPGGTHAFVVVAGYDADAVGPWTLDAEVVDVVAPVVTGGTALMVSVGATGKRLQLTVMGSDTNADAEAAIFEFLDGSGMPIGADTDADASTPDDTEFAYFFDDAVTGMATFTATVTLEDFGDTLLSDFPALVGAASLRVRLSDRFDLEGEPMTLPLVAATQAARGGTCDATNVCAPSLACETGTCVIPAAVVTACGAATDVTLTAPTGGVASEMTVDGTIAASASLLTAPCQRATRFGAELLYDVTVPAGMHDLVVTTDTTRTDATDTVVFVMSTCGDTSEAPETWCNDDIDFDMDIYSSSVEILDAAGTYTVAVDQYLTAPAAAAADVGTLFRLRPVLAMGATCDPMGVANRCAGGACPAGTMTCP